MAKVLVTTFTHDGNRALFRESFRYTVRSMGTLSRKSMYAGLPTTGDIVSGYLIIDFTPTCERIDKNVSTFGFELEMHSCCPGAGFCSNLNRALHIAKKLGIDYLVQVNDDSFIHPEFIYQGVVMMKQTGAAFVGGTPQDDGGWNLDYSKRYLPEMVNDMRNVANFVHGNWEMSACIMNVNKASKFGMDESFDKYLGLCADNDLFLRLVKGGERVLATRLMRFWHARGITQSKFGRDPYDPEDSIKKGAYLYMQKKWGVDMINNPTAVLSDFNLTGKF
jgi:hypothetical protein